MDHSRGISQECRGGWWTCSEFTRATEPAPWIASGKSVPSAEEPHGQRVHPSEFIAMIQEIDSRYHREASDNVDREVENGSRVIAVGETSERSANAPRLQGSNPTPLTE